MFKLPDFLFSFWTVWAVTGIIHCVLKRVVLNFCNNFAKPIFIFFSLLETGWNFQRDVCLKLEDRRYKSRKKHLNDATSTQYFMWQANSKNDNKGNKRTKYLRWVGYLLNVRNRAVSMSMYAVNSEDDGDNKDVADDASYRRCFLLQCCWS